MLELSNMNAPRKGRPDRCIAGESCRARLGELGTLQPARTEKPLTLCQSCCEYHREAIRRLPRDYTMLQITLGERSAGNSEPIRSTPSPVILLNTTSDRLMSGIAEWSDRAACAVAAAINTPIPTTRRQPPKRTEKRNGKSIRSAPQRGSVAETTWAATGPTPGAELSIALRFVEQHIDDLAAAPDWDYYIWAQPHRCTMHENLINVAAEHVAAADDTTLVDARAGLERARLAAALCDDCNGWSDHGQARELVYLNGFEILEQLTRLHHLTRKHLGHTKLRHHSTLPCDACGAATLGRADGTWVIDCTTCGAKYTENELGFLIRMKIDEIHTKEDNDMLRWLLAEAQWRLNQIQAKVDVLRDDDTIQLAGAGPIIIEAIDDVLGQPGSGNATT